MTTLKPLIIGDTAIHFNTALVKARRYAPIKTTEIICGTRKQFEDLVTDLTHDAAPGQLIRIKGPLLNSTLGSVYTTYKNTLNGVTYIIHVALPDGNAMALFGTDFKTESLLFRYTDEGK